MSLILNLSDPNPPVRVFLTGGEDINTDPWVELRPVTKKILREIREATHEKRLKNVRGTVHESYDVDETKYSLKLWGYCLPAWGNLSDENGNEIKHSPENVVFLLENNPGFAGLISEKMDEVNEAVESRMMAREKN